MLFICVTNSKVSARLSDVTIKMQRNGISRHFTKRGQHNPFNQIG